MLRTGPPALVIHPRISVIRFPFPRRTCKRTVISLDPSVVNNLPARSNLVSSPGESLKCRTEANERKISILTELWHSNGIKARWFSSESALRGPGGGAGEPGES